MSATHKWNEQGNTKRRRILAVFTDKPLTNAEVALSLRMPRPTAQYHVNLMLASKPALLCIVGKVKSKGGGRAWPLYERTGAELATSVLVVRKPRPSTANPNNPTALRRAARYQLILDALAVKPMGDQDLADLLGMERTAVAGNTQKMHALRLIHIAGFRMPTIGGRARTLYSPGNQPDAVRVLQRERRVSMAERRERRQAAILLALETGGTINDIAAAAGTHHSNARKYVRDLQEKKQARITAWRKARGWSGSMPIYGLGSDPDAPRPPGESRRSQSPDRVRARLGADVISAEAKRAVVASTIANAKAKPHSIFAALGI